MKLSEKEKAANKAAFQAMSPAKKAEHIFTYYKWLILLCAVILCVLVSILHRQLTKKDPVLYLALINVSPGEQMEKQLTGDFLAEAGFNRRKQEVYLYRDLYLSEDADTLNHEYAYASKMKLDGAISAQKLDLVLMNREAYDMFSRAGYLLYLSSPAKSSRSSEESALPESPESSGQSGDSTPPGTSILQESAESADTTGKSALPEALTPLLTENEVILSDNSLDYLLGNAEKEQYVTEKVPNALDVSSLPLFQSAGFDGELYLGIVANSPRQEAAFTYIRYVGGCP